MALPGETLVNGTVYTMSSGRPLINGTGYEIVKGITLNDGTARTIVVDRKQWLYRNGNQFTSVTGGWTGAGFTWGSYSVKAGVLNPTDISLVGSTNSSGFVVMGTVNAINLSHYSTLNVIVNVTKLDSNGGAVIITPTKSMASNIKRVYVTSLGQQTMQIDISSINADEYIIFEVDGPRRAMNVLEAWLE